MTDLDRKNIIKGLYQHCEGSMFDRCGECRYYEVADEPFQCRDALLTDALALLREQEPVAPTEMDVTPVRMEYRCGGCGGLVGVESAIQGDEKYRHVYCPKCGKKVLWDG